MNYRPATPADAYGIGRVQLTSWRHTFVNIAPPGYLEQFNFDERAEGWTEILTATDENPQVIFVAADDAGEIVGYICGGPAHENAASDWIARADCEVYTLHLLPTHHKQGIGKRLMQIFAAEMQGRGYGSLMLWVLTDNTNARQFYEYLGGVHFDQKTTHMNEKAVTEEAYRWVDIQQLL